MDQNLIDECLKGERPLMELVRALADERGATIAVVLFGSDGIMGEARTLLKDAERAALRKSRA